jgi:hypothetical protein
MRVGFEARITAQQRQVGCRPAGINGLIENSMGGHGHGDGMAEFGRFSRLNA